MLMNFMRSTLKKKEGRWISSKQNLWLNEKSLNTLPRSEDVRTELTMPNSSDKLIERTPIEKKRTSPPLLPFRCSPKMLNFCIPFARKNVPTKIAKESASKSRKKELTKYF